jgi:cell fate regulator YaaT (PSP1 superfamily)
MFILDAEYQFDRKKLTFYFVAHGRVDFREFTTELYQFYKTRIWLQQVDQHVIR